MTSKQESVEDKLKHLSKSNASAKVVLKDGKEYQGCISPTTNNKIWTILESVSDSVGTSSVESKSFDIEDVLDAYDVLEEKPPASNESQDSK